VLSRAAAPRPTRSDRAASTLDDTYAGRCLAALAAFWRNPPRISRKPERPR